jgi:hypothetical protein
MCHPASCEYGSCNQNCAHPLSHLDGKVCHVTCVNNECSSINDHTNMCYECDSQATCNPDASDYSSSRKLSHSAPISTN